MPVLTRVSALSRIGGASSTSPRVLRRRYREASARILCGRCTGCMLRAAANGMCAPRFAQACETMRLPFRMEYRFDADAAGGTVAVECSVPQPEAFPSTRWDGVRGAWEDVRMLRGWAASGLCDAARGAARCCSLRCGRRYSAGLRDGAAWGPRRAGWHVAQVRSHFIHVGCATPHR